MMRTDKYPVSPQSPDSAITVQLQLIAVGEKVSERARDVHSTVHPAPELFCMLFCSHFRPFRCFQQFAPTADSAFLGRTRCVCSLHLSSSTKWQWQPDDSPKLEHHVGGQNSVQNANGFKGDDCNQNYSSQGWCSI